MRKKLAAWFGLGFISLLVSAAVIDPGTGPETAWVKVFKKTADSGVNARTNIFKDLIGSVGQVYTLTNIDGSGTFQTPTGGSSTNTQSINGSAASNQVIRYLNSGTDISITTSNGASGSTNTIEIPTAAANRRGALSSNDWASFTSIVTRALTNDFVSNVRLLGDLAINGNISVVNALNANSVKVTNSGIFGSIAVTPGGSIVDFATSGGNYIAIDPDNHVIGSTFDPWYLSFLTNHILSLSTNTSIFESNVMVRGDVIATNSRTFIQVGGGTAAKFQGALQFTSVSGNIVDADGANHISIQKSSAGGATILNGSDAFAGLTIDRNGEASFSKSLTTLGVATNKSGVYIDSDLLGGNAELYVRNTNNGSWPQLILENYGAGVPAFYTFNFNGSRAAPSGKLAGELIGELFLAGKAGVNMKNAFGIRAYAMNNFTDPDSRGLANFDLGDNTANVNGRTAFSITPFNITNFADVYFNSNAVFPLLTASRPLILNDGKVLAAATGTPDGTKFLRDDGVLAVPPGSGGSGTTTALAQAVGVLTLTNASIHMVTNAGTNASLAFDLSGGPAIFRHHLSGGTTISLTNVPAAGIGWRKWTIETYDTGISGSALTIQTISARTINWLNGPNIVPGQTNFHTIIDDSTNLFGTSSQDLTSGTGNITVVSNSPTIFALKLSNLLQTNRAAMYGPDGRLTNVTSASPSTEYVHADGTPGTPSGGTNTPAYGVGGIDITNSVKRWWVDLGNSTNIVVDWQKTNWYRASPSNSFTVSWVNAPSGGGLAQAITLEIINTNSSGGIFPTNGFNGTSVILLSAPSTNVYQLVFDGLNFSINSGQQLTTGSGDTNVLNISPTIFDPRIPGSHVGSGYVWVATNTTTGQGMWKPSSMAASISNVLVTTTADVLLDLSAFSLFQISILTNGNFVLTNLQAGFQQAELILQQDTNGQRTTSWRLSGGILKSNGMSLQLATNANTEDLLILGPSTFSTNLTAWWASAGTTNFATLSSGYGTFGGITVSNAATFNGSIVGDGAAMTNIPVIKTLSSPNITFAFTRNADGTTNAAMTGTGVAGPASATDNALAVFDGTTGKLLKDSVLIATNGTNLTIPGRLRIASGSSANPSVVFAADDDGTGTGFYRSSANTIGVAINGNQAITVDSTTLTTPVNIDISNPTTRLGNESSGVLQLAADSATATAVTFKGPDGSGTDKVGGDMILAAGRPTGTGIPGKVHLTVSTNSVTSASTQNASTNVVTVGSDTTGLTFVNRANYDITTNNFVLDTYYTNLNQRAWASCVVGMTNVLATDRAQVALYLDQNGDGTWERTGIEVRMQGVIALAGSEELCAFLQPNARFIFTNKSSGATATIVANSSQWVKE